MSSSNRSRAKHIASFVLAGSLAFVTDIGVLTALTQGLGVSPFLARIGSISVAMVVSWLINRALTFRASGPPTLAEFGRFAGIAWSANIVNYLVFSAILLVRPITPEILAAGLSAIPAMVLSYLGMRLAVFR